MQHLLKLINVCIKSKDFLVTPTYSFIFHFFSYLKVLYSKDSSVKPTNSCIFHFLLIYIINFKNKHNPSTAKTTYMSPTSEWGAFKDACGEGLGDGRSGQVGSVREWRGLREGMRD